VTPSRKIPIVRSVESTPLIGHRSIKHHSVPPSFSTTSCPYYTEYYVINIINSAYIYIYIYIYIYNRAYILETLPLADAESSVEILHHDFLFPSFFFCFYFCLISDAPTLSEPARDLCIREDIPSIHISMVFLDRRKSANS